MKQPGICNLRNDRVSLLSVIRPAAQSFGRHDLTEVSAHMRIGRILQGSAILLFTLPSLASTHARRGPTSQRLFNHHSTHAASKPATQRAIDDTRATEIQTALIHAGYLSGDATGHWDSGTEAAMQKFQSDNGWQTKLIPDSRAIIKLGLGPNTKSEGEAEGATGAAVQSAASSNAGYLR